MGNNPTLRRLILQPVQEVKMSDRERDLDKDQTTRPSLRKEERPTEPSGTARQPRYDHKTTPSHASDDPTE